MNISIREYLETIGVKGQGNILKGLIVCRNPKHLHRKRTPSLSITYNEVTEAFKFCCFGKEVDGNECSLKGKDFVRFYSIIESIPYHIAKSELVGNDDYIKDTKREDLFSKRKPEIEIPGAELPKLIGKYEENNWPKYLSKRGFTYENMYMFSPLFSPTLEKYIILPIYGLDEKLISFVGRCTDDKLSNEFPKIYPRYYNPYESYNKQLLYGLWLPKITEQLVIVEGPFDVIGTYVNGFSTLGVFGIKFKSSQVLQIKNIVKQKKFSEVVVYFDYGADEEAKDMANRLSGFGIKTSIIYTSKEDKDIDAGNIDKQYFLEKFSQRKSLQRGGLLCGSVQDVR